MMDYLKKFKILNERVAWQVFSVDESKSYSVDAFHPKHWKARRPLAVLVEAASQGEEVMLCHYIATNYLGLCKSFP